MPKLDLTQNELYFLFLRMKEYQGDSKYIDSIHSKIEELLNDIQKQTLCADIKFEQEFTSKWVDYID